MASRLCSRFRYVVFALVFFPISFVCSAQQVTIDSGVLEGKTEDGVQIFLGIPYAAPPIGDLRWKAPLPPAKWTTPRKVTEFGFHCMQGKLFEVSWRDAGGSEDCLTLNVWTATKSPDAKLPVMFWVHGGSFKIGGSSNPQYDGAAFAKKGVILVSVNYRMGIFGFFAVPELIAESGHNSAGNYACLDLLAGLQWVHNNIAAFGGDPGNVTIFGESAGSVLVNMLMASPTTKGLFQKVIGESGSAFYLRGLPNEPLAARADIDLKFAKDSLHAPTLKEMRAVPVDKLQEISWKYKGPDNRGGFFPNIDGYFLPESVPAIFAAGKQNDVPLLAGWTHDEGSIQVILSPVPFAMLTANMTAKKEFGAKAQEFLHLYPATSNEEAHRSLEDFAGDQFVVWATWKWLDAQTKYGKQPAYRYRFDNPPPATMKSPAALGAFHSSELDFVFGTLDLDKTRPWRSEDRTVSDQMQKFWSNFAKTGDPNGPGLPHWPTYSGETNWQVLRFSPTTEVRPDELRARYLFLDAAWVK